MTSDDRSFLSWSAFGLALAALVLGFFALGRVGSPESADGASSSATVLDVELGSLKLLPNALTAPAGELTIRVHNGDAAVHNFSVLGEKTPDLQPGESFDLELGDVAAGDYEMECLIPGHKEAGMNGTLTVGSGGTADSGTMDMAGDHMNGYNSPEEMQAAMDARALRFVEEPKGEFGGRMMEFETLPDGTKRFEVTAAITDWEVEPGKIVQAFTYNGTVPAPEIHVEVGDKVQILLKNDLPVATVIHWHGIRVPNAMDGVPPFTQPAVEPGAEFLYEFTALEPAVGIYHSHNGAAQVLDGLFGAFTVGEMPTPPELIAQGYAAVPAQKINMVLNDAGVIGLSLNGKSFPATEPYAAKVGDTVLVNYFNEGLMAHPMHMHQPVGWIIAKDGKPLLVPVPSDTINVAPGERYTVLYKMVDAGVWAWHCHILTHAEREDGMFGMVTAFIVSA